MKKLFLLILLFSAAVFGAQKRQVCLNMIVKNESEVIERCLNSVKPIIDYWVIVDTGSSDGTQKTIKKCMKGIPGKLYERPWVNFEHNRNEALDLARDCAEYLLFIDADEELIYEEGFSLPVLDKDLYHLMVEFGGMHYVRNQFVKSSLNWKWVGVLHETLLSDQVQATGKLEGVKNFVRSEGCRSRDPHKFEKDAQILEEALVKEPENARYRFYLAQTYRDGGSLEKAMENYQKRVEMGGWPEEVFCSKYQIAQLKELLKWPAEEVIQAYSDAYTYRPSRAEPLSRMATYLRLRGNYLLAYMVANQGLSQPEPEAEKALFLEDWIYRYQLKLEKSIAAYWIGRFAESLELSKEILQLEDLPENVKECVATNCEWAMKKIFENVEFKFVSSDSPAGESLAQPR